MAACEVLAFLFCDRASKSSDGKASLRGLFDTIVVSPARRPMVPRLRVLREPTDFFVFYKAAVHRPCTLSLRVFDPNGGEIASEWSDPIEQPGLVQSVWVMATAFFLQEGRYRFELWHNFSGRLVTAYLEVVYAAA